MELSATMITKRTVKRTDRTVDIDVDDFALIEKRAEEKSLTIAEFFRRAALKESF